MGEKYKILNYSNKTIIMNLKDEKEVCVVAKVLMQQPNTSFDIVRGTKFVTSDFCEMTTGDWEFQPVPQEK